MPHVKVRPDILSVHVPGVLANCRRVPGVTPSGTMFPEHRYRAALQRVPGRGSPPP